MNKRDTIDLDLGRGQTSEFEIDAFLKPHDICVQHTPHLRLLPSFFVVQSWDQTGAHFGISCICNVPSLECRAALVKRARKRRRPTTACSVAQSKTT